MSKSAWWQMHQNNRTEKRWKGIDCVSLAFSISNHHIRWPSFTWHPSIVKFNSRPNQACWSLVLRKSQGILACSRCSYGNMLLCDATFDAVVKFCCENYVSRTLSNAKDTIPINKQLVPIRLTEMMVLDACRTFNERHPGVVALPTFCACRPREVKIASPHETCACIIHEKMDLLLKVCVCCNNIDSLLIFDSR